jgi:hypothetical protein
MAKTYPDRTFEKAMREKGYDVLSLWCLPGPKDTEIAWIELLLVGVRMFLVQTTNKDFPSSTKHWLVFTAFYHQEVDEIIDWAVAQMEGDKA